MTTARAAAFVAAFAASVAAAGSPALAARATRYEGTTSEGTRVTLRVSANGRVVLHLRIYYRAVCSDRRAPTETYTNVFNSRMRRGRWLSAGVYKGSLDGSMNDYRASGTVRGGVATGRFKWHATTKRHGRDVRCSSGPITWTARPVG